MISNLHYKYNLNDSLSDLLVINNGTKTVILSYVSVLFEVAYLIKFTCVILWKYFLIFSNGGSYLSMNGPYQY